MSDSEIRQTTRGNPSHKRSNSKGLQIQGNEENDISPILQSKGKSPNKSRFIQSPPDSTRSKEQQSKAGSVDAVDNTERPIIRYVGRPRGGVRGCSDSGDNLILDKESQASSSSANRVKIESYSTTDSKLVPFRSLSQDGLIQRLSHIPPSKKIAM